MSQKKIPEDTAACESPVMLRTLVLAHAVTITKILFPPPRGSAKSTKNSCCCCCCCDSGSRNNDSQDRIVDEQCMIDEFSVNQELQLDPNSFGVPGGPLINGTRAQISWSVRAPSGARVAVQVRTRGLDGNPGATFPDWSSTLFNQEALIDSMQYNFSDVLGTGVEFRIVVSDAAGNILCISAPDS